MDYSLNECVEEVRQKLVDTSLVVLIWSLEMMILLDFGFNIKI